VVRLDALLAARPEKRLKSLMPERFDHDGLLTVKRRLSIWAGMQKPGQSPLECWMGYWDIVSDPIVNRFGWAVRLSCLTPLMRTKR
jgi:hypothetical protein